MKRTALLILIGILFSCESNLESNEKIEFETSFSKSEKVLVNHKGKEISVSASAVEAHLRHGDSLVDETPNPGPR